MTSCGRLLTGMSERLVAEYLALLDEHTRHTTELKRHA
jgi:hypothetical protein